MSDYYTPKKTYGLYEPGQIKPFKLSRSKIDLFLECAKCFYLDRKLGVGRPPGYPFSLNNAVDTLLKREFDIHRAKGTQHPLIEEYGVDARPVPHEDLAKWRENFTGIQALHVPTNFLVTGAIDDLWQNSQEEYIVVDYKATSKDEPITALDQAWHIGYKRQMEVYQWLLRALGYEVARTGYFVYANGRKDRKAFDSKLEFDVTLIPYEGDSGWVEPTLGAIKQYLDQNQVPEAGAACDYCAYREAVRDVLPAQATQGTLL